AALQEDPTIRTAAVRYTYYSWQRDSKKGFEVLEYLSKKITEGLIPDSRAFESALGLSLIIFFEHYGGEEDVLKHLRSIWRLIIANQLHIGKSHSGWKGAVQKLLLDRV